MPTFGHEQEGEWWWCFFGRGNARVITTVNEGSDEGFLRAQPPEVNQDTLTFKSTLRETDREKRKDRRMDPVRVNRRRMTEKNQLFHLHGVGRTWPWACPNTPPSVPSTDPATLPLNPQKSHKATAASQTRKRVWWRQEVEKTGRGGTLFPFLSP